MEGEPSRLPDGITSDVCVKVKVGLWTGIWGRGSEVGVQKYKGQQEALLAFVQCIAGGDWKPTPSRPQCAR